MRKRMIPDRTPHFGVAAREMNMNAIIIAIALAAFSLSVAAKGGHV